MAGMLDYLPTDEEETNGKIIIVLQKNAENPLNWTCLTTKYEEKWPQNVSFYIESQRVN